MRKRSPSMITRSVIALLALSPVSWSQAPLLAVSARGDNAVNFYNVLGGGVLLQPAKSVAVGKQPGEMCLAPNGKDIFVSNVGDRTVAMIDVASKSVVTTFSDPAMQSPDGCAVSPDSPKLYSVDSQGNAVLVFSIDSKQVLKSIPVGREPRRVVFSPDGKTVLVSNSQSNTLSVIDAATDSPIRTVKTGDEPRDMAYSSDGKLLAVTLINDDSIQFFNASTLEPKQQVAAVRSPQHLEFSPDSDRLYVLGKINDEIGILRMTPLPRLMDVIPVTRGPLGVLNSWGLAMSGDGRFLYATNLGEDSISIIDLQIMKTYRAFPGGKTPTGAIFIKPSGGGIAAMGATEKLNRFRSLARMAMDSVTKNDMAAARNYCHTLESEWDQGASGLQRTSPQVWNQIDQAMDDFIHPIINSGTGVHDKAALNTAYQNFLDKLKLAQ